MFLMVMRDLSAPESRPQDHRDEIKIAFVGDRFLAAVFDFLIFSPVVSFCGAGFLKQIKTILLLDPRSNEAALMWMLLVGTSALIVVLLQSVFLFFWQATPGQRFMQLKVISYPRRFESLTFSQALLRSLLWTLSAGFCGIPFLEVIGHPLRRAFHERASDTLVITLKEEYDRGPMFIEKKLVSSWMRMVFLTIGFAALLFGFRTYRSLAQETYFKNLSSESDVHCSRIPVDGYAQFHRQDLAVALYLADEVSSECLNKEADQSLWNGSDGDIAWAYLAKALITEDKTEQDKYFTKVCEYKEREVCAIAQYLSDDENPDAAALRRGGLTSVSSRFLLMEDELKHKDYLSAIILIRDLQKESSLKPLMEKRYVQAAWSLNEEERGRGREPASDDAQEVLHEFKEKFGVE